MPDHIITCVYCGQQYPENTPTHGKDVAVLTEHIKVCPEHPMRKVEEELREVQALFDLRWKADMRAIKQWQTAHPDRGNVWPDHADMVVWLLERNYELLQFTNDFLKWRNGPEGPDVMFDEGAKLVAKAKNLLTKPQG